MALHAPERTSGPQNPNRPKDPNWVRRHPRLAAALGAGATVATAAAVGYGVSQSGDNDPAARPAGMTSPAPNASEAPSPVASEGVSPTDIPVITPEATPSPTSPEVVLDLDAMSSGEFAELPEPVRTDYVLSKYFILSENGSLFDFVDQQLTNGKTLFDYNPFQNPLDKNAKGDDILLAHTFAEQISTAWKPDITKAGGGENDPETAKKLTAGYAYDPDSDAYKSHIDSIENATKVTRLPDVEINGTLVINTTQSQEVEQADGKIRLQKELTVLSGGNTYKETYVFVPKDDELGVGKGLWLLAASEKVRL